MKRTKEQVIADAKKKYYGENFKIETLDKSFTENGYIVRNVFKAVTWEVYGTKQFVAIKFV